MPKNKSKPVPGHVVGMLTIRAPKDAEPGICVICGDPYTSRDEDELGACDPCVQEHVVVMPY